jgi:hypothetical protein
MSAGLRQLGKLWDSQKRLPVAAKSNRRPGFQHPPAFLDLHHVPEGGSSGMVWGMDEDGQADGMAAVTPFS